MPSRKLRWVIAGLVALLVVGAWMFWPSLPSRFTEVDYNQVESGMMRADVHAALGPPGDFRTRADVLDGPEHSCQELAPEARTDPALQVANKEEWYGDGGYVAVCFDATGRVTYKYYMPKVDKLEPLRDQIQMVLRTLLRPWISD